MAVWNNFHCRGITPSFDIVIIKDFGIPAKHASQPCVFSSFLPKGSADERTTSSGILLFSVFVELLVHHNFPSVHWQICIIEGPVKLLFCNGFVGSIVVWGEVFVGKGFSGLNSLSGVKNQHIFKEVDCYILLELV